MLEQFLEDVLADDASERGVGDLGDELPHFGGAVVQFVDQFVGVDGAVVHHCLYLHRDVVLGDHLLRGHPEHRGLHVHLDHALADGVDEVEARLEDLEVPAEGLVHSDLGSFDLVNGRFAAAANAWRPDLQAPGEGTTAFEAGLIAGAFEVLALEVLEIVLVVLADHLVMRLRHCYII